MQKIEFIIISGLFSNNDEELDILPPPPPFPKIGSEEERLKEQKEKREKEKLQEERRKQYELENKKIEEERRKKRQEESKKLWKDRKKRVYEFLHNMGLISTKEEREEGEKRKLEDKRKNEEEKIKQEELERKRKEQEKRNFLEQKRKQEVLSKKEQQDLKKKQIKEILPEMDIIVNPEETIKAEKEIQKAIDSIKEPKRNRFTLKGLFNRKEEEKQETIEMPDVMPRTFDKINPIEFVEERIHKARMALMNFDFEKAKKIYIEIMRLYTNMSTKEKYQVYQDIKDLYYERKSAEKFAKK